MTNPEPRTLPAWVTPVVASVAALAVGIGGFIIASPFAAPRTAEPTTVEALVLPTVESVSPIGAALVDENGAEIASSVTLLPVTAAEDDLRVALAETIARADSAALGALPEAAPVEPVDGSGITVLDPCPEAGDSDADCPTGSRSTVLKTIDLPDLELGFGPGGGGDACPVRSTSTSVAILLYTNIPATIDLWYEAGGLSFAQELVTSPSERAEWEADVEAGELGWLPHCVELLDLPTGWSGIVTMRAVADDGTEVIRAPRFSAAPLPAPPSWVEPAGRTAVVISVPARSASTVRMLAIAVPFGQPTPSCDFGEGVANVVEPLVEERQEFTRADLESRGYDAAFTRRFSAVFVVPEASTVTLCAGTFARSDADSGALPTDVYSEVWYSPDFVLPVVRVAEFAVGEGVRPTVRLTARVGGAEGQVCGTWRAGASVGDEAVLCQYSRFDGDPGWGSELVVTVEGTGFGSSLTRTVLLPIGPESCDLNCDLPDTRFVDVPVVSREPCLGSCPPSYLGTVRLQVDWQHGTRSWFSDWTREEAGAPESDAPRLDTSATPYLRPLVGPQSSQVGGVVIETDVPTTMRLFVLQLGEGDRFEVVDERESAQLLTERRVEFGPLPAGGWYYGLRVELTDADGRTSTYSSAAYPEATAPWRTWTNAFFRSDIPQVPTAVELSITGADGAPLLVGSTGLLIGGGRWFEDRRIVQERWCTDGPVPFTDNTSTIYARPETPFRLTAGLSASGTIVEPARCSGDTPPIEQFAGVIPYDDLFTGATITVTNENGYTATLRLTPTD